MPDILRLGNGVYGIERVPVKKIILTFAVNSEVANLEGDEVPEEVRSERWFNHKITIVGFNDHPGRRYLIPLCRDTWAQAEAVLLYMVDQGIFFRQMGGYGLPDCLRVTIGTDEKMMLVIAAIKAHLER